MAYKLTKVSTEFTTYFM